MRIGLGDQTAADGKKADGRGLRFEFGSADEEELNPVVFLGQRSVRRDRPTEAFQQELGSDPAHWSDRLAGVYPAIDLAHVGQWRQCVRRLRRQAAEERRRQNPSWLQDIPNPPQALKALLFTAHQVQELHRRQHEWNLSVELELEDIAADRLHGQIAAAVVQLADQLAVPIEADHLVAPTGQVQRHAAGATAELEDRAALSL